MNNLDTGILIVSLAVGIPALCWLFMKHDFQVVASLKIGRRNPPQHRAGKAVIVAEPGSVTEISRQAS